MFPLLLSLSVPFMFRYPVAAAWLIANNTLSIARSGLRMGV